MHINTCGAAKDLAACCEDDLPDPCRGSAVLDVLLAHVGTVGLDTLLVGPL